MERRRQNMTDFIASLNTPLPVAEPSNDFDEANIFATTDFFNFDFDTPSTLDAQTDNSAGSQLGPWITSGNTEDILNTGDFQFNSLRSMPSSQDAHPISATSTSLDLIIPDANQIPTSNASNIGKRKETNHLKTTIEERTRLAAEEDKRRRNTAASARFRVKKKQREQQLEKTAKDMSERVAKLEHRVTELEMENRWLKGLITDKNEGDGDKLSEMFAKVKEELGEKGLDALSGLLNNEA